MKTFLGVEMMRILLIAMALITLPSWGTEAGKFYCPDTGSELVACIYQTKNVRASRLASYVNSLLMVRDKEYSSDRGDIKQSVNSYTVEFYHVDPEILEWMKRTILSYDKDYIPAKRKEILVEMEYYYFSQNKAKERGFSLDFVGKALEVPVSNAGNLGASGLNLNFGNLINHWVGFNINYARNQQILSSHEIQRFTVEDRTYIDHRTTQVLYRDNSLGTNQETAQKGITGDIRINNGEGNEIRIENFRLRYPREVNSETSLVEIKEIPLENLRLESGQQRILEENIFREVLKSEDGRILGSKSGENEVVYKFVAAIRATVKEKAEDSDVDSRLEEKDLRFFFTERGKSKLPSGEVDFRDLFGSGALNLDVFSSPYGALGNGLNFRFDKARLTKNVLALPVIMELYGEEVSYSKVFQLENFFAGPVFFNEFDSQKIKKSETGEVKFKLRFRIPEAALGLAKARGLKHFATGFEVLFYPGTGLIYPVSEFSYEDYPDYPLKKQRKSKRH